MRLVCIDRTGTLRNNITTVANIGTVGQTLKNMPGVGRPFLIFSPAGWVAPAAVDFDLHPEYVVSAVVSENVAMIEAMLANPPIDSLTFPSTD